MSEAPASIDQFNDLLVLRPVELNHRYLDLLQESWRRQESVYLPQDGVDFIDQEFELVRTFTDLCQRAGELSLECYPVTTAFTRADGDRIRLERRVYRYNPLPIPGTRRTFAELQQVYYHDPENERLPVRCLLPFVRIVDLDDGSRGKRALGGFVRRGVQHVDCLTRGTYGTHFYADGQQPRANDFLQMLRSPHRFEIERKRQAACNVFLDRLSRTPTLSAARIAGMLDFRVDPSLYVKD